MVILCALFLSLIWLAPLALPMMRPGGCDIVALIDPDQIAPRLASLKPP